MTGSETFAHKGATDLVCENLLGFPSGYLSAISLIVNPNFKPKRHTTHAK
jgi:hypothetical protein